MILGIYFQLNYFYIVMNVELNLIFQLAIVTGR